MTGPPPEACADAPRRRWQDGRSLDGQRTLAAETPVAIVVNASSFAVMLASPADLADFARGFALSEGIVDRADEIAAIDIVAQVDGIEARLWVPAARAATLAERRRHIAGPTGCGLCGIESLGAAVLSPGHCDAAGPQPSPDEIVAAIEALADVQPIGRATRAVHAAALWRRGLPLIVREDVGRHNALDKLIGAVAQGEIDTASAMLLLSSRVSVEMVHKAAVLGAPLIVAISAPTSLAVAHAVAARLTLIAVARADGFEVFTRPERVAWPSA